MIKIIKGVYGVKRANSKSAPFTLSKDEEARLVSLGVAEYVTAPEEPDAPIVEAHVEEVPKATKKTTKKTVKK